MRWPGFASLAGGYAAGWLGRMAEWSRFRSRRSLRVRPLVAYPIARDAVAMSEAVAELRALAPRRVAEPALCLAIENSGRETIVVEEIGLQGWFDRPRLGMREPLLHDGKPWPRILAPGEKVIAYFAPSLRRHVVLRSLYFAYALSDRAESWWGAGPALRYFAATPLPKPLPVPPRDVEQTA